jgi:hypothetical protein
MSAFAAITPLVELAQNEFVQSKVEEAAKLFYTADTVTINLLPALIAGSILLLLLIPLLSLLFQPAASASGTGYGAPEETYGAPAPAYGAPEYRSDSGDAADWEDFKSLFSNVLSAKADGSQMSLQQKLQEMGPLTATLGNAAAKLLE